MGILWVSYGYPMVKVNERFDISPFCVSEGREGHQMEVKDGAFCNSVQR